MDKKQVVALVRSDIRKHQKGEIDRLPTVIQYAKLTETTVKELTQLLRTLTEREQAYCYSHEDNGED